MGSLFIIDQITSTRCVDIEVEATLVWPTKVTSTTTNDQLRQSYFRRHSEGWKCYLQGGSKRSFPKWSFNARTKPRTGTIQAASTETIHRYRRYTTSWRTYKNGSYSIKLQASNYHWEQTSPRSDIDVIHTWIKFSLWSKCNDWYPTSKLLDIVCKEFRTNCYHKLQPL